jgi:hypothetical protein
MALIVRFIDIDLGWTCAELIQEALYAFKVRSGTRHYLSGMPI